MTAGGLGRPGLEAEDKQAMTSGSAATAHDLWLRLLLYDPDGSSADLSDPEQALRRLHGDGQPGGATTALVLLTSWQWRRSSDELLGRLLAARVLDDAALDELADVGLFEHEAQFVLPGTAFSGPAIVLAEAAPEAVDPGPAESDAVDPGPAESDWVESDWVDPRDVLPVRMSRPMRPPVRRWAAGHVLRRCPGRLDEVRQGVDRLDPRSAAAGMAGVLDALEVLPPAHVEAVLRDALGWPHRSVRLRALRLLAARGKDDEAVVMAQHDPDVSIRAAATSLAPAEPHDPATLF